MTTRSQKYVAEFIGTAFLLATVIGSGIMAENLADGNVAIALLGNTLPTGAILVVLITFLGPLSGAHFNPAVTLVFMLQREIPKGDALVYVIVQVLGGLLGMVVAHLMFAEEVLQASQKLRQGAPQWLSEWVATFGLVLTIFGTLSAKKEAVAVSVGLYITAAYWFTASTSFANPAVTVARSFTNTFSGIHLGDTPGFILAQIVGAFCALMVARKLFPMSKK